MKRLLTVFLALMGFAIMMAGCGTEAAKSIAGAESSGSAQAASGKVQTISSDAVRPSRATKIRLTFDGGEAVAELYDNPTSRDLVFMLPLTLSFQDFNGTEKISYSPRKLSTEKAPEGFEPSEGDLTLYAPWGNLAIFYHDFRYSKGLVPIGYFTSGLEALAKMNGEFTVRIEAINE
ncbi:hypothetical protein SCACP_25270 [Sporomusa carbonis]|uniref:cyclophilin-like fold protein n=1 Tax=Sporomusa carbonis TaxID=3076075 RepID=UPI003A70487E